MAVRCELHAHCARHKFWLKPLTVFFPALWASACNKTGIRTALLALALIMTLGPAASGQRIYWGVIGGTNLTPDFPRYDISAPADIYGPADHFEHLPGPRSFILGGLLEVKLTNSLAVEVNALHRALPDIVTNTELPAGSPSVTTTVKFVANTWEFPVMLKWSLPSPLAWGRVRPFLEGGPAFRTSQDDVSVLPSQFGVTAGAGVAVHFGHLRLAPTIRYTRWEKENYGYPTKPDQVELLTSLAWGTSSDPVHLTGHRFGLGVVGGLSLLGELYFPYSGVTERVGYLAGASGQLELREGLALEVDAIYKPLHDSNGGQGYTVLTWDFPVLAKYHLAKLGRAPFVEVGPSFRAAGNLNGYNPSHFGVTAGGGLETRKGRALLSTALRYTRWLKDGPPNSSLQSGGQDYDRTNANAVELIFGIGY